MSTYADLRYFEDGFPDESERDFYREDIEDILLDSENILDLAESKKLTKVVFEREFHGRKYRVHIKTDKNRYEMRVEDISSLIPYTCFHKSK